MASTMLNAMKVRGTHNVGSINDWEVVGKLFAGGAKATVDLDNYIVVSVAYDTTGEATITPLADKTKKGLLVCAVEQVLDQFGEQLCDFYVATGERARVIYQPTGTRFQVSNYSLNAGVTEVKAGLVAHYDPATKKYIISDPASAHADYATAGNKYTVHAVETELEYTIDDMDLVQLIAQ